MKLIEIIENKLHSDERFVFDGVGFNHGSWSTGDVFFDFKKNIGGKGFGKVRIILFKEDSEGVEMKIEIWVPSYCEWYTFFEGFIESEDDYKRVLVMTGIN